MNKAASIPSFAGPAFVEQARSEFEALVARYPGLEVVDAVIVDICGAMRGKRLPMAEAERLFESGMQLPKSVYLMDAKGEMVNPFGRGFGDGDPDGTAWPLPGTISRVWGEGPPRAQLFPTIPNDDATPLPAQPPAPLHPPPPP